MVFAIERRKLPNCKSNHPGGLAGRRNDMPSLEVSAPCGGHPPLLRERDMRRNGTRGAKFKWPASLEAGHLFLFHSACGDRGDRIIHEVFSVGLVRKGFLANFLEDNLPLSAAWDSLLCSRWTQYLPSKTEPFFEGSLLARPGRKPGRSVSIPR